ncbi:hypothetical protein BVC80_9079g4 [Macleaya cordata]|uniref:Uncharacterized protein n=1 Tax=Macleaya cordata TaxID=56857 RepID=A0A200PUH7_MACCD|nr:hypothetical protein BVC80_9079g4 [Macleaya cordata]
MKYEKWKISCFRHEESSSGELDSELIKEKLPEELAELKSDREIVVKKDLISSLRAAAEAVFRVSGKPWTVPWTAETIIQVDGIHSMDA